jgi:hypothetical protein
MRNATCIKPIELCYEGFTSDGSKRFPYNSDCFICGNGTQILNAIPSDPSAYCIDFIDESSCLEGYTLYDDGTLNC